jgi:hypothetical protein
MIMSIAACFPGLVKSASASDDEVAASSLLIAEMIKAMTYGDVGALKPAHKDLQTTLKLFLAADIPAKGEEHKAAKRTIEMFPLSAGLFPTRAKGEVSEGKGSTI